MVYKKNIELVVKKNKNKEEIQEKILNTNISSINSPSPIMSNNPIDLSNVYFHSSQVNQVKNINNIDISSIEMINNPIIILDKNSINLPNSDSPSEYYLYNLYQLFIIFINKYKIYIFLLIIFILLLNNYFIKPI
jgi:hypothetical protein